MNQPGRSLPTILQVIPDEKMTNEEIQVKYQQQIALIEENHTKTLNSLIWKYERQLKEKQQVFETSQKESETLYQQVVQREIDLLKNSWTWKIGFAQTSAIRLAINFLKNPVRFFKSQQYRWHNIYFYQLPEQLIRRSEQKPAEPAAPVKREIKDCVVEIKPGLQTFVCVLDTFTKTCFEPEFSIVSPSPENWKKVFDNHKIDGVFVESAWHGNDDAWQGLTSNYSGPKNLEAMTQMLTASKKLGIRSFFWNKEDPVHFSRFIETARLFDYVFTSDAEIVHKYKEQLGHDHVYALPFAAQHKIHNPVRSSDRNKNVSFAGTYYNFSFAERKIDMDALLKPSMAFGLEIFDRNFGATGLQAEQFGFPAIYKPAVRGKLEYHEMLQAYKDFKVYLNVNSVKYSSTMFARRVFELLACGTPVISNYAKGIISLLGEGTVFISENEEDTRKYLEKLLGDQHFWWRHSLNGMRIVMEGHTYTDRTSDIFSITGHKFSRPGEAQFTILSKVSTPDEIFYISALAQKQLHQPAAVVFLTDVVDPELGKLKAAVSQVHVPFDVKLSGLSDDHLFIRSSDTGNGSYYAFFNPESYYGPNYLRDFKLADFYCGADIMGKAGHVTLDSAGNLAGSIPKTEYRWLKSVPVQTLVIRKHLVTRENIQNILNGKEFSNEGKGIFSLDPFNFMPGGRVRYQTDQVRMDTVLGI